MNKSILLLIAAISLSSTELSAKGISYQNALDRALNSATLSYDMPQSRANGANVTYSLAYSAPSGSYFVFDRSTGGYIIVSGDDRIYPVLADVTSGEFSSAEIAPAAKFMIDSYDKEILSLAGEDEQEQYIMDYYTKWNAILPLMTTEWNQNYPYNIYCPAEGSTTCVTGCVATAMAQVVRRIGYYKGSGYRESSLPNAQGGKVKFDYAAYDFDFDNMFDSYPSAVTDEQLDQVGSLMLACGLSVRMGYGTSASAASSANVPLGLINNFGFDSKQTRLYSRSDFSQAKWESMLYSQLQLERPVYYSGASGTVGHAFVIDGYRPMGMYHVNWGWGGMSDGYYRLSALNPAQQGIGGGSGGFSAGQDMVIAVPQGEESGIHDFDLSGSIRIVSDGVYAVYYKSNGVSFINVSIGAAIVDSYGNIVTTATFWPAQQITATMALRHDSFSYDFTNIPLSPGNYRIYPAYCPDGGQYTVAEKIINSSHYINLEVTESNEYIFTNIPLESYSSDIHIAGMAEDNDIHRGCSGSLNFYVVNNGNKDYTDKISLTMLDGSSNELVTFSSNEIAIAGQTTSYVTSSFPVFDSTNALIPIGIYTLRFADSEGNILSDGEFSVEVKKGNPLTVWENSEKIEVTNPQTMPSELISGDVWPHTPLVETSQTNSSMTLRLAFYPPSSLSPVGTILCYQGTIGPMSALFPIEPKTIDIPFGTYEVCYRKGYSQISQRVPVRIGVSVDNLYYLPGKDGGVAASLMQKDSGKDEIVVPSQVTINGTSHPVTSIDKEAFILQPSLSVVDLPSDIKFIGMNALAATSALQQIIIRAEEPPFAYRNYVAAGLSPQAAFYVPASAYHKYKPILGGYNPVYTLVETIESATKTLNTADATASLTFTPAHEAVNPAFVITPVDEASASVAEVNISSVASGKINLEIKALDKGSATFHVHPAHRSEDYAVLNIEVPEVPAAIEDISSDPTPLWPVDVYTTTGILLQRNFTESQLRLLPKGIYILRTSSGARKIIL